MTTPDSHYESDRDISDVSSVTSSSDDVHPKPVTVEGTRSGAAVVLGVFHSLPRSLPGVLHSQPINIIGCRPKEAESSDTHQSPHAESVDEDSVNADAAKMKKSTKPGGALPSTTPESHGAALPHAAERSEIPLTGSPRSNVYADQEVNTDTDTGEFQNDEPSILTPGRVVSKSASNNVSTKTSLKKVYYNQRQVSSKELSHRSIAVGTWVSQESNTNCFIEKKQNQHSLAIKPVITQPPKKRDAIAMSQPYIMVVTITQDNEESSVSEEVVLREQFMLNEGKRQWRLPDGCLANGGGDITVSVEILLQKVTAEEEGEFVKLNT